ncbi:MAG: hypothetical protein ACHQ7M_21285 [Chloroflexota bacterium]|jgi:hypothetical protein|nr:hypothetical protein [Micrococcaceae bacterium]
MTPQTSAEWWQIVAALSPLAILLAAVVAAIVGLLTLRQKSAADARALAQRTEADNRSEWWRRTQWALDKAMSPDADSKALGLATLSVLARSELARAEELQLLDIAWKSVMNEADGPAEDGGPAEDMDPRAPIGDNGDIRSADESEEAGQ